jgi:hypothetical protein
MLPAAESTVGSSLANYIPQGIRDAYGAVSDFASNLFTPEPLQLSGPGSTMTGVTTGATAMPSAGGNLFGIPGLTGDRLLGAGSELLGTYLRRGDAQDTREYNAAEREREREFLREMGIIDQETPYGNIEYTKDPVTGRLTRRMTLDPADQQTLDYRRAIQHRVGANADKPMADYTSPYLQRGNALIAALPAFGGNYLGGGR